MLYIISGTKLAGEDGTDLHCPSLKTENNYPNFGKISLLAFKYGLNLSFKMLF